MGQETAIDQGADLAAFLARHHRVGKGEAVWLNGAVRLQIGSYVSLEPPPMAFVAAARSIVFRSDEVLVMRNADEWHVLPGGGCEAGETPTQTLSRELLEEAGLRIKKPHQLGFMHLHHVTPKPHGYGFLYPDSLSLVYVSEAGRADDRDKLADDYEEESDFRPIAKARELDLSVESRLFLEAAISLGRVR